MNKVIPLGVFLIFSASACVTASPERENRVDTMPTQAQIESAKSAREEEEKAKRLQAENQYQSFLKTFNCNAKDWARYEFGEYFQSLALQYKISPFDLAKGDAYARRNIPAALKEEIQRNYHNYTNTHIPWETANKFYLRFPTIEEEWKNQRAVFNELIKRDYGCYKKLK